MKRTNYMNCPKCNYKETKVYDSRPSKNGKSIIRRRKCLSCGFRFATSEDIKMFDLKIEKRNGQLVDFDSEKLAYGIRKSFNKRSIDNHKVDQVVSGVIEDIMNINKPTIKSTKLGTIVLKRLRSIDEAAYICYWAMFGNFQTAEEFNQLLKEFQ